MSRAKVDIPTVAYKMLENNIGYIQVSEFAENTPTQFSDAITDLQGQGMEKLVIDLRDNGGGMVVSCQQMLDMILPEGTVVYTEDNAIIENKQAIEMAKIYSDILSGTMDTYASIISNNLNAVMKILTSVTFILAIPTLIASIWGMNVELPFQREPLGFLIITVFSIIMCIVATIWLKRKRMLN